jgi:hypothetical protein
MELSFKECDLGARFLNQKVFIVLKVFEPVLRCREGSHGQARKKEEKAPYYERPSVLLLV